MTTRCLLQVEMRAFLSGELPAAEEERVGQHLERCADCERLAADLSDDPAARALVGQEGADVAADVDEGAMTDLRRRLHVLALYDAPTDDRPPDAERKDVAATVSGAFIQSDTPHSGPPLARPCDVAGLYYDAARHAPPLDRLGRFQIIEQIGAGGFGIVYLAEDTTLHRQVAIKVARASVLADPGLYERFFREAEALGRLDHPHITPVFAADEIDGTCFLVMAYCPGKTLQEWLTEQTGPADPHLAARLLLCLAQAVEHAHQQGILHRDIKPGNVLLSEADRDAAGDAGDFPFRPLLTDFGLAKIVEDKSNSTLSGVVLGTAQYMAPEQAAGHLERVGPPTDVYALGAMLYEVLSGRPPIEGRSMIDTLRRLLIDDPVEIRQLVPEVPEDLSAITMKCLEKSPGDRYATAAALADDLQRFLTGRSTKARPLSAARRSYRWVRRNPAWSGIAALAVAVVALSAGLFAYAHRLSIWREAAEDAERLSQTLTNEVESHERKEAVLNYVDDLQQAAAKARAGDFSAALAELERAARQDSNGELGGPAWHYLWALVTHQPLRQAGTDADVYQIRLSPRRPELAAATRNGWLRLYDSRDMRLLDEIETGHQEVNGVAYSPDGAWLATAGDDGMVRIWSQASLQQQLQFPAHDGLAFNALFADGGTKLITCGNDPDIKLWDAHTGELLATLPGHTREVEALALSPDGKLLASASSDRSAILWDLESRKPLHTLTAHEGRLTSVAFSPDGKLLVTGALDEQAIVWNVATGKPLAKQNHVDKVQSVSFSVDGERLYVGDRGGKLCDYRVVRGKGKTRSVKLQMDEIDDAWVAHRGFVWCLIPAGEADQLYSAGQDGKLKAWGRHADADRVQRLAPAATGDPFNDLEFSPDGSRLFAVRGQSGVVVLDVDTLKPTATYSADLSNWTCLTLLRGRGQVAAGNGAGQIAIWDLEGNQPPRLIEHPESPFRISQLVWSRAAGRLAVVPWDVHDVFLYDLDARELVHRLPTDNHSVAAFSPDGKVLAADSKQSILLFDVASGSKIGELIGHSSTIYALDFQAGGKLLASASGDRTTRLWALDGSQPLEMRHTSAAMDVDFVAEGATVVSVDADGVVKLGRAPTQSEVCDLPSLGVPLEYIAASPDGRRLAVIDENGNLAVLGASPRDGSLYPVAP